MPDTLSTTRAVQAWADNCNTGGIDGGGPVPVGQLVVDAARKFNQAHPRYYNDTGAKAFWPRFDGNKDGIVDFFCIIHAGMVETAYVTTYYDQDEWQLERVPYNIPGAVLDYRNEKYDSSYKLDPGFFDAPSIGPKYQLLVVNLNHGPMRLGDTPETYVGYLANFAGSTVIPAQTIYTTRVTDFYGAPYTDLYGTTQGGLPLGSGNPGDDWGEYGVRIDVLHESAGGSKATVRSTGRQRRGRFIDTVMPRDGPAPVRPGAVGVNFSGVIAFERSFYETQAHSFEILRPLLLVRSPHALSFRRTAGTGP